MTTILFATLLLSTLSPSPANAPRVPEEMELDSSGRLQNLRPLDERDQRDNIALFGQRPTLLILPSQVQWKKSDTKDYVQAIKKADRLASDWKRAGFDVLFIDPEASLAQRGDTHPQPLDLIKMAKVKNMNCATNDRSGLSFAFGQTVQDELLGTVYSEELEFRWILLKDLGHASQQGERLLSKAATKELKKLRKSLDVPLLAKNKSTSKIFSAINEWRLGDAYALLEKSDLAEKSPEESAALHAMLVASEAHYRKVFCMPLEDAGYLPEVASGLERLAEVYFQGQGPGAQIAEELALFRGTTSFAGVLQQQAAYRAVLKTLEDMEAEAERAYLAALGRSDAYDETKYYQAIAQVYPAALEQVAKYLSEERDSPYRKEIAMRAMEAREDLEYARQ